MYRSRGRHINFLDLDEKGKMFIGGLSLETTQDSLYKYFSRYGEVIDCVVMKNAETGRSRGFGFITFANPANVDVILNTGPHSLDNRTIDPKPCNPRSMQQKHKCSNYPKVFLGGLPSNVTETLLKNYFSVYGNVKEVVIMYDQDKKKSRGFGFLSFDSDESVERCVSDHFVNINGKQVEVKHAEPRDLKDELQRDWMVSASLDMREHDSVLHHNSSLGANRLGNGMTHQDIMQNTYQDWNPNNGRYFVHGEQMNWNHLSYHNWSSDMSQQPHLGNYNRNYGNLSSPSYNYGHLSTSGGRSWNFNSQSSHHRNLSEMNILPSSSGSKLSCMQDYNNYSNQYLGKYQDSPQRSYSQTPVQKGYSSYVGQGDGLSPNYGNLSGPGPQRSVGYGPSSQTQSYHPYRR